MTMRPEMESMLGSGDAASSLGLDQRFVSHLLPAYAHVMPIIAS